MPIHSVHLGAWDLRTWTLLGQLPFLALMLLLCLAGRRRGWPWRASLLATAALAGGLSLGTAVLPSVLGAVAGAIAAWLGAQRLLGLRRVPFATLALGVSAMIAVGRWGCLLNDCCFGRPSNLPWAIHYGTGSATWSLHRALGWIPADTSLALGVHPYPLYESMGLLLWLPFGFWLLRRLRSEAALLAFTAAYDLALRALLDGSRAMINVWWTLLDTRWGLGIFQWALAAAALACLGAGLALERRARARTAHEMERAREPAVGATWAIFLGLWAIGWLCASEQTLFLHRVLVGALGVSALALRLPAWVTAPRWVHAGAAPVLGAALAIPVVLHVGNVAQAGGGAVAGAARQGWLYEVDHQRGVMVRVGTQQESPADVAQRRAALGLTGPAALPPAPAPPEEAAGRTWLAAGGLGGHASYRVGNSCGGDYTLYDRSAGGGWVEVEHEVPATPTSVLWVGGRASALFESQTKTVHSGDTSTDVVTRYAMDLYTAQLWGEWEHPNLTLGTGFCGTLKNQGAEGDGARVAGVLRPAVHVRAGASFLAVDAGYCDRGSLLGLASGHIGLSGAIGKGARIRHPDDTLVRYYFGGLVFPGADTEQHRFMLGGGLEMFASPRLAIGLAAAGGDGFFGLGYLRAAIGGGRTLSRAGLPAPRESLVETSGDGE